MNNLQEFLDLDNDGAIILKLQSIFKFPDFVQSVAGTRPGRESAPPE